MTTTTRFPIRFDGWYRILSSSLLLRPSDSYVELNGDDLSARMGWAFSARIPRSSVVAATLLDSAPLSRAVHGFAGRWLVNGSGDRILVLDLKPTEQARVLGLPVRLRQLLVSLDNPMELADRLRRRGL